MLDILTTLSPYAYGEPQGARYAEAPDKRLSNIDLVTLGEYVPVFARWAPVRVNSGAAAQRRSDQVDGYRSSRGNLAGTAGA